MGFPLVGGKYIGFYISKNCFASMVERIFPRKMPLIPNETDHRIAESYSFPAGKTGFFIGEIQIFPMKLTFDYSKHRLAPLPGKGRIPETFY